MKREQDGYSRSKVGQERENSCGRLRIVDVAGSVDSGDQVLVGKSQFLSSLREVDAISRGHERIDHGVPYFERSFVGQALRTKVLPGIRRCDEKQ